MQLLTVQRHAAALVIVLAVLAIFGVPFVGSDNDGDGTPDSITYTVDRDGATPGEQPVTVTAPTVDDGGLHEGARNETPDNVSRAELQAGLEQQERLAASDQLPAVTPFAAPEQAGCTTRLVQNYSTRRGVRPRLFVLHLTVSPNRPGWDDVNAIVGLFDQPSFAASSHYVIDREGHCAYIVRESDKAWTQAAANPVSISVEIINNQREGSLISGAGRARLVQVMADSLRRWDIPARQGAVAGCSVARSGILDHNQLGACGGGHVDVNPYRGEIPGIISDVRRRIGSGRITSVDRVTCRKLNAWRNAGRPRGGRWERNSVRRKRALTSRGVTCTARGPVRSS